MVMRALRLRTRAATPMDMPPMDDAPAIKPHPQKTILHTLPNGSSSVAWTLEPAKELPWRRPLLAATVQLVETSGQLLLRINDAPPSGVTDVRGDVRVILAQSYEDIRGPRIEQLGFRYIAEEAADEDTPVRVMVMGWTEE